MARPKSTAKAKTTAKKTTSTRGKPSGRKAKPAATKTKPSARKATIENPKTGAHIGGMNLLSEHLALETRRPPNNPDVPQQTIDQLNATLTSIRITLDNYSQHLRALDRARLNGVGVKKLGFIERAYELALENTEFLPHYLTIQKFGGDIEYFQGFRSLVDLTTQIREKLWNIVMQSADIAYTNALEFYASVSDAARRRVDAAETLHNALSIFFRHHRRGETEDGMEGEGASAHPTEKQLKRDANALLHGKRDGKLVIENVRPRLSGGKRAVLDETFHDTAQFRDTLQGDFEG